MTNDAWKGGALGHDVGVVLLAAGFSSRMGRPKLLLPWSGTTVMGHLIGQWQELGAAQIAVVMRADDMALAAELDRLSFPRAGRITNPEPERGMFSSIVCAARWHGWLDALSSWAIVLGDQPHLRLETLRELVRFAELHTDAICQPAFAGRAAHPVILPGSVFNSLKQPGAETLKEFLKLNASRSVQLLINDPGLSLDLDTPEDYKRALIL